MKQISRLHFITTSADLAEQACQGGVDWIQLRLKNVAYDEYKGEALKVQEVCKKYDATLIINDNLQLALDIKADGVHLGKEDMHPDEARALLGPDFIIGSTANTYEDVRKLSLMPINYIGLGPYRFTSTKENLSPILGLEGYSKILGQLNKDKIKLPPVVAIGGIGFYDISQLFQTGIDGIAISGAISRSEDIPLEARAFLNEVNRSIKTHKDYSGISSIVDTVAVVVDIATAFRD